MGSHEEVDCLPKTNNTCPVEHWKQLHATMHPSVPGSIVDGNPTPWRKRSWRRERVALDECGSSHDHTTHEIDPNSSGETHNS